MAAGAADIPCKGSIRNEYCPSHIQIEWDISLETLQQCEVLGSPVFAIEKQRYMLKLERQATDRNGKGIASALTLLRMGPSVSERSYTGQYWFGMRRKDGTYGHKFKSGILELKKEHKSWEQEADIGLITTANLDELYLTSEGRLTFFFRFNIKRAPSGVETCTHGTPQMPKQESGYIQQEECSCHMYVEWCIDCQSQRNNDNILTSPVFKIGTQVFFFELLADTGAVSLRLYRSGRSVEGPAAVVRYWIGLKCQDGRYYPNYFSEKLDLSEDFGLWTPVATKGFNRADLEKQHPKLNQNLVFFFRMNAEPTKADLCSHGTFQLNPSASGSMREERCSSHTQVQWDIDCEVPPDRSLDFTSPDFEIGTQRYFLKSCFRGYGGVELRLFRFGRSVRGPVSTVRCWASLKCKEGTYENFTHQIDLREDVGLWTELALLISISGIDVVRRYLTLNSRITFRFRMNTQPTLPSICKHDLAEKPPPVSGRIREEQCSSHKHVEWEIGHEVLREQKLTLTSPVFTVGTQRYYMEWVRNIHNLLRVYRLGHSVNGPAISVRCWAGLKYLDETYFLRNFSKTLDMQEDLRLWTVVASSVILPPFDIEENVKRKYIRKLTFFFRMNVEPAGEQMCTHGPVERYAPSGEGIIQMQNCPSHKHVLWKVDYEESQGDACFSTSPVFEVRNQWYQVHLRYRSKGPVILQLYRSGSAVQDPTTFVRFWAGLKSAGGSYHHHTQMAELDLREECSLPTQLASFKFPSRSDLERTHVTPDGHLTFFFQIDFPQSTADGQSCYHDATEMCPPGKGRIREQSDNFVEWDVSYEGPQAYTHFTTSPVFEMGAQCYLLELCYEIDGIVTLGLYRFGRSFGARTRSVRCWAGLKRDPGMYDDKMKGVELDLSTDCDLWTRVKDLGYFSHDDLLKQSEAKDSLLTFFFLTSAEFWGSDDVAVQTDKTGKLGFGEKIFSKNSEGFRKLKNHFKLWLRNPDEGHNIRRLRREEFEATRWKIVEKRLREEEKEPSFFAA